MSQIEKCPRGFPKSEGPIKEYYESGELERERFYKDGKPERELKYPERTDR